jgi:DNA-binding CsgD family transcriptional regulator
LAAQATEGYAAAAPMLKKALRALADQDTCTGQDLGWLTLACRTAHNLWDDESWYALSTRQIELARRTGALRLLPVALLLAMPIRLIAGDLIAAAALAGEAATIARATGTPTAPYGPLLLAAWRGRPDETRELIASATRPMVARGEGQWLTVAAWATAVASNGWGRYEEALAAAEHGSEYLAELGLATWSLAELIEAAARTGQPERATGALQRLAEITTASGSDWALGVHARCQALLSDTPTAEDLYCDAIARLGRTRARADLARAHLLYGEWLRRRGRRADARQHLYAAHGMFAAMGAGAFAERAQRELLATGETVRKRAADTLGELTAQEAQIARLAGAGHTNPEISSQLFISPRTVEWHLRKVFTKLGITSRKQLSEALPGLGRAALPT